MKLDRMTEVLLHLDRLRYTGDYKHYRVKKCAFDHNQDPGLHGPCGGKKLIAKVSYEMRGYNVCCERHSTDGTWFWETYEV